MPKINLEYMPTPKREYTFTYSSLVGGLNILELDYRLSSSESPDMQNLVWKDGCLNSRDGQVWIEDTDRTTGVTCYDSLFHGYIFFHAGTSILYKNPDDSNDATVLCTRTGMTTRGTFFVYDSKLYYKTKGFFIGITYADGAFTASDVTGFVPVIVINASPTNGSGDSYQPENRLSPSKTVWYNAVKDTTAYHLPVVATSVGPIYVDGVLKTEGTDYTYSNGVVTFTVAPPVTTPATNNTVKITYTLANTVAYNNIMDCVYAKTYGGTGALCVAFAGSLTQPNAYFWNGNTNIAMDVSYWPVTNYQLAGDTSDAITGFGVQQSYLVIFKSAGVGRTILSTTEVDDRTYIDMPYTPINDKIGCDLPWTIQLIDNNLVWCNTEQGVHLLKDSSSAYENNIVCLSSKVNGSPYKSGLLEAVREGNLVCSCDDTRKYWVVTDGKAWAWDYSITEYKDPSWFYFTNIGAVGFILDHEDLYHVDSKGRLTHFERCFADYDGPIEKVYQFATQIFDTYDTLKNVNSTIITTRSDTNGVVELTYITDYERRKDLTDLKTWHYRLTPRNLAFRTLEGRGFAEVFRRRPMCRRVRHFAMRLENNATGEDLSVVTAQLFYNFQGKERGRQIR